MKNSKQIYSEVFKEYMFSEDELHELHKTLFDMLLDVKKVCDKYKINFVLAYGTLLGAVRHHGFIPWDDDIDIMMLQDEYDKFKRVFVKEMGDKYDLVEPLEPMYTNKKPKIFLKKSVFNEVVGAGLPDRFRKVFLDVFPIVNVPRSVFVRCVVSKLVNFAYFASSFAADYKYPSPIILEKCKADKNLKKYYRFRRFLGCFFNLFFGLRFYIWLVMKLVKFKKETGLAAPTPVYLRGCVICEKSMFTDLIEVPFEGVEGFKIPKDYDRYLRMHYGDYMKLPPENERESHTAAEFEVF